MGKLGLFCPYNKWSYIHNLTCNWWLWARKPSLFWGMKPTMIPWQRWGALGLGRNSGHGAELKISAALYWTDCCRKLFSVMVEKFGSPGSVWWCLFWTLEWKSMVGRWTTPFGASKNRPICPGLTRGDLWVSGSGQLSGYLDIGWMGGANWHHETTQKGPENCRV